MACRVSPSLRQVIGEQYLKDVGSASFHSAAVTAFGSVAASAASVDHEGSSIRLRKLTSEKWQRRVASLGLPAAKVSELLRKNPSLVEHDPEELQKRRAYFKRLGLNTQQFCGILVAQPRIMNLSLVKDIRPAVLLLQSALEDINAKCIALWPSLLEHVPRDSFQLKVDFLVKAGFKKGTKDLAKALSFVVHKSAEDMEATIAAVTNYGLSQDEAFRFVRLQPCVMQMNVSEVSEKVDYLVNTVGFSAEKVLAYSSIMLYNLDSRIKPRHRMHEWLKSQGLNQDFKLAYYVGLPEKDFVDKHVTSHPGAAEVYHKFLGHTD